MIIALLFVYYITVFYYEYKLDEEFISNSFKNIIQEDQYILPEVNESICQF